MSKLTSPLGHSDVEVLSTQTCHEGFLKLDQLVLRHRLHAGGWSVPLQREILLKEAAVGILLFDPVLDKVVLVRQFRIGAMGIPGSPWLLELAAGMAGPNEDPLQVAVRESVEESNCTPQDVIRICDYLVSPGTSNERLTLFCGRVDATTAAGIHGLPDEHEDIEVVVLDMNEAVQAIATGVIHNAMTIIAIQWLQLHKSAVLAAWK